jgi:uncharacterized membrane protein
MTKPRIRKNKQGLWYVVDSMETNAANVHLFIQALAFCIDANYWINFQRYKQHLLSVDSSVFVQRFNERFV